MEENSSISKSTLTRFIERIKKDTTIVRIMCEPRTFEDVRSENFEEMSHSYFKTKLSMMWLDAVPERVDEWISILEDYFAEFGGKWRYYACSKRINFIKELGGDDEDYNEDGTIKTEGLTDEMIEFHTVVNQLYHKDSRDILQDMIPEDLSFISAGLLFDASFDMQDMVKAISGKTLPIYTIEDGEIREIGFEEHELNKALDGANAQQRANVLHVLGFVIYDMINWAKDLTTRPFDDNRDELLGFLEQCQFIKNMELEKTSFFKRAGLEKENLF